jgi:hypothetical protein
MTPIDVVYILGKESRWADTEIRYSLRSVETYLTGYRRVVIIGQLPPFINPDNVLHIPHDDIYGNKARNIKAKILRAANDSRVTQNFILFNDDYFLLKPTFAPSYPYYYKNTLPEARERNLNNFEFLRHIESTMLVLKARNLPLRNFDSHFPIVYNKKSLRQVCDEYNWNVPHGYIMKSLYCNTLGIIGGFKEDCKINHPHIFENWPNVTRGLDMFSIGDRCINKSMEQYLHSLYPNPSKFEFSRQI